jgi:hypothetical protein
MVQGYLSGTQPYVVGTLCADDAFVSGKNVDAVNKNREAVLVCRCGAWCVCVNGGEY